MGTIAQFASDRSLPCSHSSMCEKKQKNTKNFARNLISFYPLLHKNTHKGDNRLLMIPLVLLFFFFFPPQLRTPIWKPQSLLQQKILFFLFFARAVHTEEVTSKSNQEKQKKSHSDNRHAISFTQSGFSFYCVFICGSQKHFVQNNTHTKSWSSSP